MHAMVDIFFVSGLPNCLCEGELDSAAMTPSWHRPREAICTTYVPVLLILIVGVSCLFICLQFFAAVVVDVLIKESCVEWNSFKQEEKKSVQYRAVFLVF